MNKLFLLAHLTEEVLTLQNKTYKEVCGSPSLLYSLFFQNAKDNLNTATSKSFKCQIVGLHKIYDPPSPKMNYWHLLLWSLKL